MGTATGLAGSLVQKRGIKKGPNELLDENDNVAAKQSSLFDHFRKKPKVAAETESTPSANDCINLSEPDSLLTKDRTPLGETTESTKESEKYEYCNLEYEQLGPAWLKVLEPELGKEYFKRLKAFLREEAAQKVEVFPPSNQIYTWASLCPPEKVKVVILGQDPYHGPGQAMGLAFSVPVGVRIPPSLANIFQELANDLPETCASLGRSPSHGCLNGWAKQGVLLLNASLTVRAHAAASHANRGWEKFTDAVIRHLGMKRNGLVFILWGNHAIKRGECIDRTKHLVLQSVHPSPLSASRGFFGSRPFSQANQYLVSQGKDPIDWSCLPKEP